MNLNDAKVYLSTRINSNDLLLLSDLELNKYYTTSLNLLETFYKMEDLKSESKLAQIVGEEMLFLFNSDIDLELFYTYEGLKQFSVEGAIAGTVAYDQVGDLFSRIVKSLLKAAGIEQIITDPGAKVKNTFTWL